MCVGGRERKKSYAVRGRSEKNELRIKVPAKPLQPRPDGELEHRFRTTEQSKSVGRRGREIFLQHRVCDTSNAVCPGVRGGLLNSEVDLELVGIFFGEGCELVIAEGVLLRLVGVNKPHAGSGIGAVF